MEEDKVEAVPRRRRKMVRGSRDKTPDPQQTTHRWSRYSDSENDSSTTERKNGDDKSMSDHKRKILDKKNKALLNRRSLSNPRVVDNNEQSELFALLRTARRSLSTPREPTDSRDNKLQTCSNRSIPNLRDESKSVKPVVKPSEVKPSETKLNARNTSRQLVKKPLNNDEKQDLINSFNQAQKATLNKVDIDNDTYESSTESCSISESDHVPSSPSAPKPPPTQTKPDLRRKSETKTAIAKTPQAKQIKTVKESNKTSYISLIKESRKLWKEFKIINRVECGRIKCLKNKCIGDMIAMMIFCGCGGMIFKFTEGTFENFYKCGVKRVKRDFIDQLWTTSMHMREDDWKSQARNKLRAFEEELHAAHEAGMKTYSGQRGWSFLNGVVYCLTVVTTIGYGHISPVTTTGRAITIAYAIIGIPMFLILLADFGKLFTRCIKFVWAFVRRVYYTGSCRKVRRTAPVQEVMKGFNMVYDLAHFRRPSQAAMQTAIDPEMAPRPMKTSMSAPAGIPHTPGYLGPPSAGVETPQTPAPSAFEIDDEFNLPISVAIIILLVYIFIGATIYYIWEDWGFFESFYFVFISMSTIGFGDFVPQHPMYMMASIVYLVFGLALTSMCINVVQVKLSDSFRQASAKIGATIGLKMAEGEASAAGTPPSVEIADVHGSSSRTQDSNK